MGFQNYLFSFVFGLFLVRFLVCVLFMFSICFQHPKNKNKNVKKNHVKKLFNVFLSGSILSPTGPVLIGRHDACRCVGDSRHS